MNPEGFRDQVWESFHMVASRMDAIFSYCCEQQKLTVGQSRVLFLAGLKPHMTMSMLSRRLGVAPGNLSPLCKKLENEGLIDRLRSQQDERVVEISLTPLGKERVELLKMQLDSVLSGAVESMSEKDIESILTGIQKMEAMLQKVQSDYWALCEEQNTRK